MHNHDHMHDAMGGALVAPEWLILSLSALFALGAAFYLYRLFFRDQVRAATGYSDWENEVGHGLCMLAMAGAMASTPEGEEEYSHLTRLQRYSYAAGAVGVWGPLVAFSALRSTIYVIYLEAVRVHAALCVCVRVCMCAAFRCSCTCQHVRMRTSARLAGAPASNPHAMPAPRGARPRGARPTRGARPPH